jgi:cell division protein FtsB
MAEDETCSMCIEKFTKQPHKKQAKCPYCDVKACVTCTQTYLLGTHEDAHCMGCRRGWSREVMDQILLTTWINGAYKLHRQNVLLDRERSRLPAAQIFLENVKKGDALVPQLITIQTQMTELQRQIQRLQAEYHQTNYRISMFRQGVDMDETNPTIKETTREKRAFVMPCPATGCRGFLSTSYKCGICDIYCCPDCHEIKGINREAPHTCDQNTLATVRAIKKECRNCPDCGTNIFKIEGCDQMYCTNCNTAFSWKTGHKVTNGVIHNPHYFEYLRVTNGGVMPRNPGDIPCAGNLPGPWGFDREVQRRYPNIAPTVTDWLYRALNVIAHIQQVEIPNTTNGMEDTNNNDINVRYLSKELTEVRWKQLLAQREKRRIKRDEIRQRYEAFVGACADIYGRLMQLARDNTPIDTRTAHYLRDRALIVEVKEKREAMAKACAEAKEQLLTLRKIFNDSLMDISKRYKCQVMQLSETGLKREMKKYEAGRAPRRVRRSDGDTVASSSTDNFGDTDDEVQIVEQNVLVRQAAPPAVPNR